MIIIRSFSLTPGNVSFNTAERELQTSLRSYPGFLRLKLNPLIFFIINQQETRLLSETLSPSTEQSVHLHAYAMVF